MKKVIYFIAVLLLSLSLSAQTNNQVADGLIKINALAPGVSYELGVGTKTTLNFEGFFGFALFGGSNRETDFGLFPGVALDARHYINFNRRLSKGKNIANNTGNYISFLNQVQSGSPIIGNLEYASDYFYNTAIVYGLQRTYRKGFYYGLAFGPAIFINEYDTNAGILIDARIGWVIGGRNK